MLKSCINMLAGNHAEVWRLLQKFTSNNQRRWYTRTSNVPVPL